MTGLEFAAELEARASAPDASRLEVLRWQSWQVLVGFNGEGYQDTLYRLLMDATK